jgi:leader peptidase (prepilin peptidase)/N-methyltransferase
MFWIHYLILFIFGTGIGSFLNVLTLRYKPGKPVCSLDSLKGRSHCPYCKKKLKWFELIPLVSFFIQKGKCRKCGHKLSLQYPIVEFLAGAIFVGVPYYLINFYSIGSVSLDLGIFIALVILWILVFLTWLVISIIDLRHYLVPNELSIFLVFLGLSITAVKFWIVEEIIPFHNSFLKHYTLIFSPFQDVWLNHLLGAFAGALFFWLIIVISRGKAMGWGDVKLAFASGLIVSWPEIALSIIIAFILGGLVGFFLIKIKKKTMSDMLPFAPFLVIGMVTTIFFGYEIIQGYLGLFGL